MARTINFDFRIGGGGPLEVPYGFVTLWATKVFDRSSARVLTMETKVAIQNGLATISDVETNGVGPTYEMAYWVQVEDYNGNAQRFLVAVPNGTGPINFLDLKFLDYITGDVLLDIEEWIALYGDLPNRVSTLEGNAGKYPTVDTVAALPTASTKAGSAYYVTATKAVYVSDGTKWNVMATMRVDNTAGRAIYLWDDTAKQEQLVYGDTGWRAVLLDPVPNVHNGGEIRWRRRGSMVTLRFAGPTLTPGAGYVQIFSPAEVPDGFRPMSQERTMPSIGLSNNATTQQVITIFGAIGWLYQIQGGVVSNTRPSSSALTGYVSYQTDDPWPSVLPGTFIGIPNK